MFKLLRHEFPKYDPTTLPKLPKGFVETSWHNDACPSWEGSFGRLKLYIDWQEPSQRDTPSSRRFTLCELSIDGDELGRWVSSDAWEDMQRMIQVRLIALSFVDILKGWLTVKQWEEMRERNAKPEYDTPLVCASHDFCDANMAMLEAFEAVTGAEMTHSEAEHGIWNDAWNYAKEHHMTEGV